MAVSEAKLGNDSGLASSDAQTDVVILDTGLDAVDSDVLADSDSGMQLVSRVGGLCDGVDAGSSSDGGACGCSRRTGNSSQCPAGAGASATASVGPSGGTVTLQGNQGTASGVTAEINIASGALSTDTAIGLVETSVAPPGDLLDWSPVYAVEPVGLALAQGSAIRFPWSNSLATTPRDLAVWFSPDGQCFTRVPDSYTNAGFEQGTASQLGYFIVGSPRSSATATCP